MGELKTLTMLSTPVNVLHERIDDHQPLFVFIHGFAGQIFQFMDQIVHFRKSRSVMAVDFVGYGAFLFLRTTTTILNEGQTMVEYYASTHSTSSSRARTMSSFRESLDVQWARKTAYYSSR